MTSFASLSTKRPAGSLGVLSVHLDGERCRVGCEWCYLGQRSDGAAAAAVSPTPVEPLLADALARLDYDEVAVAVSEPAEGARAALAIVTRAAAARGRPVAITTTQPIARAALLGDGEVAGLFDGVARVSLSVDPRKGLVDAARVGALAAALKARHPALEVVLLVTLQSPEFAARVIDGGLLAALVDLGAVDKVALNALKPPPPWCDRAFWLGACARLQPLLARALETRLFLDCYVAARLLGLGDCPARADLSPGRGGVAFRGCVYQPAPDFVVADGATLARRLGDFTPPARCPFPVD